MGSFWRQLSQSNKRIRYEPLNPKWFHATLLSPSEISWDSGAPRQNADELLLIGSAHYGITTPSTRTIFVKKCSIKPDYFPQSIPLRDRSCCSGFHFLFSHSLKDVFGQPREIPGNLFLNLSIVLKAFPALICSAQSNKNLSPCQTSPQFHFCSHYHCCHEERTISGLFSSH